MEVKSLLPILSWKNCHLLLLTQIKVIKLFDQKWPNKFQGDDQQARWVVGLNLVKIVCMFIARSILTASLASKQMLPLQVKWYLAIFTHRHYQKRQQSSNKQKKMPHFLKILKSNDFFLSKINGSFKHCQVFMYMRKFLAL